MWGRLAQDGRQVRRAVKTDDGADLHGSAKVLADLSFELIVAMREASESCEMASGGSAGEDEFVSVEVVCFGVGT